MKTMKPIKQRGEERTGSSMCAKMVQQAWGVTGLAGRRVQPHKHDLIPADVDWPANLVLLINIKDPYAWLVSWHSWIVYCNWNVSKIPQTKGPIADDFDIEEQCRKYNEKYENWLSLPNAKTVIRYEDVLEDPQLLYAQMEALLGVAPDESKMWKATPDGVVFPAKSSGHQTHKFDKAYYVEKRYFDLMSADQISRITDAIDWNLLTGLYEPLT